MKLINIFLLFILFAGSIFAQNSNDSIMNIAMLTKKKSFSVNIGIGYANYNIDEIKKSFNELPQLDFPTRITDNFPNVPMTIGEVRFNFQPLTLGAYYSVVSTGGRIAYSDYSGSYKFDAVISSSTSGILLNYIVYQNNFADLILDLRSGFTLLNYQLTETFKIGTEVKSKTQNMDFDYISYQIGVRLNLYYSIFEGGVLVGYNDESGNETNVSFKGGRYLLFFGLKF